MKAKSSLTIKQRKALESLPGWAEFCAEPKEDWDTKPTLNASSIDDNPEAPLVMTPFEMVIFRQLTKKRNTAAKIAKALRIPVTYVVDAFDHMAEQGWVV